MRIWVYAAVVMLAGCAHQQPEQSASETLDLNNIVCKSALQPEQKVDLEMVYGPWSSPVARRHS